MKYKVNEKALNEVIHKVYEEEVAAKEDLARQCQKAEADANLWRMKVICIKVNHFSVFLS